jgi:hypothetical protein
MSLPVEVTLTRATCRRLLRLVESGTLPPAVLFAICLGAEDPSGAAVDVDAETAAQIHALANPKPRGKR